MACLLEGIFDIGEIKLARGFLEGFWRNQTRAASSISATSNSRAACSRHFDIGAIKLARRSRRKTVSISANQTRARSFDIGDIKLARHRPISDVADRRA